MTLDKATFDRRVEKATQEIEQQRRINAQAIRDDANNFGPAASELRTLAKIMRYDAGQRCYWICELDLRRLNLKRLRAAMKDTPCQTSP